MDYHLCRKTDAIYIDRFENKCIHQLSFTHSEQLVECCRAWGGLWLALLSWWAGCRLWSRLQRLICWLVCWFGARLDIPDICEIVASLLVVAGCWHWWWLLHVDLLSAACIVSCGHIGPEHVKQADVIWTTRWCRCLRRAFIQACLWLWLLTPWGILRVSLWWLGVYLGRGSWSWLSLLRCQFFLILCSLFLHRFIHFLNVLFLGLFLLFLRGLDPKFGIKFRIPFGIANKFWYFGVHFDSLLRLIEHFDRFNQLLSLHLDLLRLHKKIIT